MPVFSIRAAAEAMTAHGESPLTEHAFHPFEVTPVHLIYVGFGAFVVLFASFSLFIKERLYLGEAPIAALFGIIVGPVALNLFHPAGWGGSDSPAPGGTVTDEITLELLRVTIALSVFAAGVELPKKYLLRHWRSLAMLLGPVMIWGWMITGLFIFALIPRIDFINALVIAAAVTPTDPILSASVIGGPWAEKHVPAHIRHLLMCESGSNDGAAFPFLYFALYWSFNRNDLGFGLGRWVYEALLYEIVLGTILGALIGYLARKLIRASERHKLVDRESFVAQYVSLALLSMGINVLLGSDDLLAAFACGTAFAWDGWFTRQTEDSNFSSIVDLLFNVATFIYIGANMPFAEFANAAGVLSVWRLIVLAILVFMFKRIPIVVLLWKWIPDIKTFRDSLFVGHFGPVGAGALFIVTLGRTLMPEEIPNPPETSNDVLALVIRPIGYFLVLVSILLHGLTIPFFSFAKGAHKVTRTWSRHASMGPDGEPGWMTRAMRRTRTGESGFSAAYEEEEGGGMSEIRRVLQAQLAGIGHGAIGGEQEEELRRELSEKEGEGAEGEEQSSQNESSNSSKTGVAAGGEKAAEAGFPSSADVDLERGDGGDLGLAAMGTTSRTAVEDEEEEERKAKRHSRTIAEEVDDLDDVNEADGWENDCSEWAGEDTCEVRRFRQARRNMREATMALRRKHREMEAEKGTYDSDEARDFSEAPMDRDLNRGDVLPGERDSEVNADYEGQAGRHHRDKRRSRHEGDGHSDELQEDTDGEVHYPCVREWIEGDKLVLEAQMSRSDDPVVEVIHLSEEEAKGLREHKSPALKWVRDHESELEHLVEEDVSSRWTSANARHKLLQAGIPKKLAKARETLKTKTQGEALKQTAEGHDSGHAAMAEVDEKTVESQDVAHQVQPKQASSSTGKSKEKSREENESAADRDARAELLFGAMNWASQNREPESIRGSRRASERSLSPTPKRRDSSPLAAPRPKPARPASHRRSSKRKKLLAGEIGLSGRKRSLPQTNDEAEEEEEEEEEVEEQEATEESESATPVRKTPKNFPRAASLGGLSLEKDGLSPSEGGEASGSRNKDGNFSRTSTISWLDVDGARDRAAPTPGASRRPRTIRIAEEESQQGSTHKSSHRKSGKGLSGFLSSLRSGGSRREREEQEAVEDQYAQEEDVPQPSPAATPVTSDEQSESILMSASQTPRNLELDREEGTFSISTPPNRD